VELWVKMKGSAFHRRGEWRLFLRGDEQFRTCLSWKRGEVETGGKRRVSGENGGERAAPCQARIQTEESGKKSPEERGSQKRRDPRSKKEKEKVANHLI